MKTTTLFVMVLFFVLITSVSATWCDVDFAKRINVSVDNAGGAALSDYQVYVNLSSNPINETSLRVYNSSDCTSRDFWCEEISAGNCTKLWIKHSSIAASAWTNNTAIYYDNAAASSASNGTNTLEFFDGFETLDAGGGNPVLTATQGWEVSLRWGSIALLDGIYYIYYVSNGQIGRATSTDLITWTKYASNPLFTIRAPSLLKELDGKTLILNDSKYWMATAPHAKTKIQVRSASAIDSDTWAVETDTAITPQAGTWYANGVYTNSFVKEGSTYYIAFQGYNSTTTKWKIGYATASSPEGPYTVQGILLEPSLGWEGVTTGDPELRKFGSTYYLFYTGGLETACYNSYATSSTINGTYTKSDIKLMPQGHSYPAILQKDSMYYILGDNLNSGGQKDLYRRADLDGAFSEYPEQAKWVVLDGSPVATNSILTLAGSSPEMIKTADAFSRPLAVRTKARITNLDASYNYFGLVDGGYNTITVHDLFGFVSGDTDTYETMIRSHTLTEWRVWDILWNSSHVKFYADGDFDNETTNTNNISTANLKLVCRIHDAAGATLEMDWIFVRKYASPEPSTTLGSEEQQGANPTLHIDNAINIKEDWGRDVNSNLSANVTTANASGVWMNFTNAEFTNTSLSDINLTLNEWVNESHNVNAPVTNVSVTVYLNSTTSGATNDTDSFYYEITKRTNTATMDSSATQNVDTSESFYVNATCNEEYGDSFLGAANLLEDGAIIDTNSSVTNYVNFSHSESSAGVYNYTIGFYNLTHYDNATTPTYSNVTVYDVMYEPPNPTNLQNVTGNFWVNHTWSAGTPGNVTDSFNVSVFPGWYNTTTNTYYNDSGLLPHDWNNVTVYAYNSSGNGSLSVGSVSDDVQIPNNLVTLTVTQTYNKLETETVFISDTLSSDADTDTPTYSCNRTDLFIDFSTVTGYGNWTTGTTDSGVYHVDIGVSDGWSSTNNKTLTITIGDATPGTPSGLANTTGNFWINHTWTNGVNTNTFNVSVNLSWNNGSSNEYYNNTPLSAHKWSNVSVYGFNSTSGEISSGVSQNTQIPNNVPVLIGLPDNTTDEDVNQTDIFDLDAYFTDADSDTPTYLVESNNQSAYVSVTINASNNVSHTLVSGWNGTASVVINATDGYGGEDSDTFLIIVNAAPPPGDYIPGDPTTLQNTTGNYWVNHTWNVGGGNVTDSYNVSWNLTWYNTTTDTFMQKEVGASNWGNITVYAFNSSGNGTLSTSSISDNVQAPAYTPGDYPPATPTTLANTTGNGWVNYTWSSGGGANITDSYNVSWNSTWFNTTLVSYMNDTVSEFGWANITVFAFNSSGNGSLSAGSISDETQADGGTFTTPMITSVYNLITYYGSSTSTAEQFGLDIGSVNYTAMYNGSFYSHTMGYAANNFTVYHGIGYYVYLNASGSSTYQRNNISDVHYNTQLFNRWNTIGWTNSTDTNAEGIATSIGSACKYTSMLNADGVTYTTHTVGFTSNNHVVAKGKGYWVWTNAGVNWGRNS